MKGVRCQSRQRLPESLSEKLLDLLKEPRTTRANGQNRAGGRDSHKSAAVDQWVAKLDPSDAALEHHRTEALWVKQYHNAWDPVLLKKMLRSPEPGRAAATRVLAINATGFRTPRLA